MVVRFLSLLLILLMGSGCDREHEKIDSGIKTVIGMNPKSEVRAGLGVNADTLDLFEECIDMQGAEFKAEDGQPEPGAGSPSTDLQVNVVSISSYQDLDQFTDVNVSANIKSASYSGSFNYSQTEKYAMTSDLASVGIQASADYGRWYLKEPKLKPEYQSLYERSPQEFFKRCGSEFVSGYRRGQGVLILLSTSKKSVETYEKISASVQASVNSGTVTGNASASFLNIASSLLKMGSLNVEVRAYGGGPLSTISGLITAKADVESLATQISNLVNQMTPVQSSRYVMMTSPYPGVNYSEIKSSPVMRDYRQFILRSLFADYRRLQQDLNRAAEIVRNGAGLKKNLGPLCTFPTKSNDTCDAFVSRLDGLKTNIEGAIRTIDELTKKCSVATDPDGCKSASAGDVRVSDLTIKTWEQQYRRQLEIEYIQYLRDPDHW